MNGNNLAKVYELLTILKKTALYKDRHCIVRNYHDNKLQAHGTAEELQLYHSKTCDKIMVEFQFVDTHIVIWAFGGEK